MSISPERIKQLRNEQGWSQEQLSEVAGISHRTIQRIEKDGTCSPESHMAIASAFHVSPDELLTEFKEEVGKGGLNISGIVGMLVSVGLIIWSIILAGRGALFFDAPSLLLSVGMVFALSVMSSSVKQTVDTICLLKWFFIEPKMERNAQQYLPTLRKLILYSYTSGAVLTLVGLLATFSDPYYQGEKFFLAIAVSFLTLFYGAILAELLFRPLKNKIMSMLVI
jgi:DNA-binding XRE family transcriptional regulator